MGNTHKSLNIGDMVFRPIKQKKLKNSSLNCLIRLKDNRIATSSEDKTIFIINPKNNYHCDISFKVNKEELNSIIQIDNGYLVSASLNYIELWKIGKTSHEFLASYQVYSNINKNYQVEEIVALSNNRIAVEINPTILIYKGDTPFQSTPIHKITFSKDENIGLIYYLREKEIIISTTLEKIYFLCGVTYQCICVLTFEKFTYFPLLSSFRYDKNVLILYLSSDLLFLDLKQYKIIKKMVIAKKEPFEYVVCGKMIKLKNNKILCGAYNGYIKLIDYENDSFIVIEKKSMKDTKGLLVVDSNTFISADSNSIIEWKY